MIKVLFVCMGNICRSPTAEGVFRDLVTKKGLEDKFVIDSAGTHAYHVGSGPDERSESMALKHGIDISSQRARRVSESDFADFDYILAMDKYNVECLLAVCPVDSKDKVQLFLNFAQGVEEKEVPDPYNDSQEGFSLVFDLITQASEGFLECIPPSTLQPGM